MSYEFGESIFDRSIVQWFVVDRVPEGAAPQHIREQWLGVPLPLRHPRNLDGPEPRTVVDVEPNDDGVYEAVHLADSTKVLTNDAIKALRLSDWHEAAEWWLDYQLRSGSGALYFVANEGKYFTPSRLEDVYPGVNSFDNLA